MADPDAEGAIEAHLERYVTKLRSSGAVSSPAVEAAFRRVPRHRLLESFYTGKYSDEALVVIEPDNPTPDHLAAIYADTALVTRVKNGLPASSSSAPGLMASMLELLELQAGMNVLEIGAGTGYNAALLAELVGDQRQIVTVDVRDDVVAQSQRLLHRAGYGEIAVVRGDGFYGYEERAPFDRIIVTVGSPDLSPHWIAQLTSGGFVLVPLRQLIMNPLIRVWSDGDVIEGRVVGLSGFMMMEGELHDASYWPKRPRPDDTGKSRDEPVWGDFAWRPQPGQAWVDSEWGGFWYFVATRDRRAWMPSWQAFGLWDEDRGTVVISEERITTVGDDGLRSDLEHLYAQWHHLGRPAPSRYRLRFVPLGDGSEDLPTGAWKMDRRFFRQLTWVDSGLPLSS